MESKQKERSVQELVSNPLRQHARGGYGCEFVESPPRVLQSECPICLLILCDPYQAPCCGKSFCRTCVERVQSENMACPTCNEEKFTVYPNKGLKLSLNEFKVRCPHQQEGCEWVGELMQLDTHLNTNPQQTEGRCQMVEVECNHCGLPFQRRHVEVHQNDSCPRRPFSCDYCRNYGADYEDVVEIHWPVCPCYPLLCPNECDWPYLIERQSLEQHLQGDCHLEVSQLCQKQDNDVLCLQSYSGKLPVEFIMSNFDQHKRNRTIWFSPPFYTHPYGYKICLEVDADGIGSGKDTHVSVGARLMRGDFDESLPWPFQGHITVQLLNQLHESGHCTNTVVFSGASHVSTSRVTTRETADRGKGIFTFLAHNELEHSQLKNCQYLKNDHLFFRVVRVANVSPIPRLEKQCLTIESHICIIPIELTMSNFEQYKDDNDVWHSTPFYTHAQGYRMCLVVCANGCNEAKGTHVSLFVHLMRGRYDHSLKWPFRGGITIQLLNQLRDSDHHTETIHFTAIDKVLRGIERGNNEFIHHTALGYNQAKNCQYLMNDCLGFRVIKLI